MFVRLEHFGIVDRLNFHNALRHGCVWRNPSRESTKEWREYKLNERMPEYPLLHMSRDEMRDLYENCLLIQRLGASEPLFQTSRTLEEKE